MSEHSTDCRAPEGVTVGLIDAIITTSRVLKERLYGRSRHCDVPSIKAALDDLRSDEDVAAILHGNAYGSGGVI